MSKAGIQSLALHGFDISLLDSVSLPLSEY